MITLIDRADGTPLTEISPQDFLIFQDQLVRESEQDFDYYLNDGTLDLLATAGLSEAAVSKLAARMRHRGLDVGWEHSLAQGATVISGSVVDANVDGLGGIRIDVLSHGNILAWTYSRSDGSFQVGVGAAIEELFLRLSGRGDLVLREVAVTAPGEQGQFEVQTLYGVVKTETDRPLAGVNVLLADWKSAEDRETTSWAALGGQRSWGDTDDQGYFAIPVSLPEDVGALEVELELVTVTGETLETVVFSVDPSEGFDLGVLRAPEPTLAVPEDGSLESANI